MIDWATDLIGCQWIYLVEYFQMTRSENATIGASVNALCDGLCQS